MEIASTTKWSELDPRSLAVFRMALGFLVVLDQLLRLRDLSVFYTDSGVLPRTRLFASSLSDFWLSLHATVGGPLGEGVLMLVTTGLGLGLMLGWRSRWMALGCWFMLNSLLARNPFVNDRGDSQLELMLFWGMFLPLDACWSLGSRRRRSDNDSSLCRGSLTGFPAAGLILQFALIYLMAAVTKRGDYWLGRGDAFEYSLASPIFARPLATWLLEHGQPLLHGINYLVIVGELFVGLLLLCPVSVGLLRGLAVGLAIAFHLGVATLFHLGMFPFVGALCLLALLPSEVWNMVDRFRLRVELSEPGVGVRRIRDATIVVSMVGALVSNLPSLPGLGAGSVPRPLLKLTEITRIQQHWELFSPLPPINGQFRVLALGAHGEQRVLWAGPPTAQQPQSQEFPNHRWRMLMLTTLFPDYPFMAESVARELVRRAGGLRGGEKIQYEFVLNPMLGAGRFDQPRTLILWRQVSF